MQPAPATIAISNPSSVEEAVQLAVGVSYQMKFSTLDTNLIASSVSEVATNVLKYAQQGEMHLATLSNGRGLRIEISDHGPGIADIVLAMQDGYSIDPTSLGVGLGATKRAMDYVHIQSEPHRGTTVHMEKWLPISKTTLDYGVASMPDANFPLNGDGYVFKEHRGDCLFAAVIDGLGQGADAWETTQQLRKTMLESYSLDLELILKRCEQDIKAYYPRSGAAIGLLAISPGQLRYLAVGDTFAQAYSKNKIHLISKAGIVGAFPMPSVQEYQRALSGDTVVVMGTDGIHENFTQEELPLEASAQSIADYLILNHRRSYGDATVSVIKIFQEV